MANFLADVADHYNHNHDSDMAEGELRATLRFIESMGHEANFVNPNGMIVKVSVDDQEVFIPT